MPEDFAGPHFEREIVQHIDTLIASRSQVVHLEHHGSGLTGRRAHHRFDSRRVAHHHAGQLSRRAIYHGARAHAASFAEYGHTVRVVHDLAKFVGDQQDAERAALHHGVQTAQDFVGLGQA